MTDDNSSSHHPKEDNHNDNCSSRIISGSLLLTNHKDSIMITTTSQKDLDDGEEEGADQQKQQEAEQQQPKNTSSRCNAQHDDLAMAKSEYTTTTGSSRKKKKKTQTTQQTQADSNDPIATTPYKDDPKTATNPHSGDNHHQETTTTATTTIRITTGRKPQPARQSRVGAAVRPGAVRITPRRPRQEEVAPASDEDDEDENIVDVDVDDVEQAPTAPAQTEPLNDLNDDSDNEPQSTREFGASLVRARLVDEEMGASGDHENNHPNNMISITDGHLLHNKQPRRRLILGAVLIIGVTAVLVAVLVSLLGTNDNGNNNDGNDNKIDEQHTHTPTPSPTTTAPWTYAPTTIPTNAPTRLTWQEAFGSTTTGNNVDDPAALAGPGGFFGYHVAMADISGTPLARPLHDSDVVVVDTTTTTTLLVINTGCPRHYCSPSAARGAYVTTHPLWLYFCTSNSNAANGPACQRGATLTITNHVSPAALGGPILVVDSGDGHLLVYDLQEAQGRNILREDGRPLDNPVPFPLLERALHYALTPHGETLILVNDHGTVTSHNLTAFLLLQQEGEASSLNETNTNVVPSTLLPPLCTTPCADNLIAVPFRVATDGHAVVVAEQLISRDGDVSSSSTNVAFQGFRLRVVDTSLQHAIGNGAIDVRIDLSPRVLEQLGHRGLAMAGQGTVVAFGSFSEQDANAIAYSYHVDVYRLDDDSTWVRMGSRLNGAFLGDAFGSSLSLSEDGTLLTVGAPFDQSAGYRSGSVFTFRWDGDEWVPLGNGLSRNIPGMAFGSSVALLPNGKQLVAGAPQLNSVSNSSGGAFLYHLVAE